MIDDQTRWSGEVARVDTTTSIRHSVVYADRGGGDRMFVCMHEPPTRPRGAVLICSSVIGDFIFNYQREVHVAHELAAAGFSVARFHYVGVGNSEGDPASLTIPSMIDDARWVAEQVTERWDVPLTVIGTRWGAAPAVAVANDHDDAPVVLCEPIVRPERYFREAIRSIAMSALASGSIKRQASRSFEELLEVNGFVDVTGHVVYRDFYTSAMSFDPVSLAKPATRPALIVQFTENDLRPDLSTMVDGLGALGWHVETEQVAIAESWWFRTMGRLVDRGTLEDLLTTRVSGWSATAPVGG